MRFIAIFAIVALCHSTVACGTEKWEEETRKGRENDAAKQLLKVWKAQVDLRANDRDGDSTNNFWVKDVAGLHGAPGKNGNSLKLIDVAVAKADKTAGVGSYPSIQGAEPFSGYWFAVVPRYEVPEGEEKELDPDKSGRNFSRFAVCAYPAEYPKSGKPTFFIEASRLKTVWMKDLEGKPLKTVPLKPSDEGWKPKF